MMNLRILLPTEVLADNRVSALTADAENGSFCLLPRHIDFVTALKPGVLTFLDDDDQERFAGLSDGILVKQGRDVLVSVEHGVLGDDLAELKHIVRERFSELDEQERVAVSAVARLEADFVRRYLELEGRHRV